MDWEDLYAWGEPPKDLFIVHDKIITCDACGKKSSRAQYYRPYPFGLCPKIPYKGYVCKTCCKGCESRIPCVTTKYVVERK